MLDKLRREWSRGHALMSPSSGFMDYAFRNIAKVTAHDEFFCHWLEKALHLMSSCTLLRHGSPVFDKCCKRPFLFTSRQSEHFKRLRIFAGICWFDLLGARMHLLWRINPDQSTHVPHAMALKENFVFEPCSLQSQRNGINNIPACRGLYIRPSWDKSLCFCASYLRAQMVRYWLPPGFWGHHQPSILRDHDADSIRIHHSLPISTSSLRHRLLSVLLCSYLVLQAPLLPLHRLPDVISSHLLRAADLSHDMRAPRRCSVPLESLPLAPPQAGVAADRRSVHSLLRHLPATPHLHLTRLV